MRKNAGNSLLTHCTKSNINIPRSSLTPPLRPIDEKL